MKRIITPTLLLFLLCQTTIAQSQQTDSVLNAMADQFNNYTDTTTYEFSLSNEAGNPIKLSDFKGKTVLLNFWSTTCGPCIAQIPIERKFHKRISKRYKDFAWINISSDKDIDTWRKFLKNKRLPGENVIAVNTGSIEAMFHVDEYPTFILINRSGQIIGHTISNADETKGVLLEYLIFRGEQNIKSGDALKEFMHQQPVAKKFIKERMLRLLL